MILSFEKLKISYDIISINFNIKLKKIYYPHFIFLKQIFLSSIILSKLVSKFLFISYLKYNSKKLFKYLQFELLYDALS